MKQLNIGFMLLAAGLLLLQGCAGPQERPDDVPVEERSVNGEQAVEGDGTAESAGLAMAAVIFLLQWLPLLPLMVVGVIVYLVVLLGLGTFSPAELRLMLRVTQVYRLAPAHMRHTILNTVGPMEGTK